MRYYFGDTIYWLVYGRRRDVELFWFGLSDRLNEERNFETIVEIQRRREKYNPFPIGRSKEYHIVCY